MYTDKKVIKMVEDHLKMGRRIDLTGPFNPGSAKQKQELFAMLGIEPLAFSEDTGDGSWGRDHIETLLKQSDGSNKDLDEILECMIDHSFSGIIRNNFLKAFDTYTIDDVLHGNIKVFGAKSLTMLELDCLHATI